MLRDDLPIERGSAGVPFIYVPLRDLNALGRANPGAGLQAALAAEDPRTGVYLFVAPDSPGGEAPVRSRMFAPGMGIVEDAATGAAAGPLGAYVTRHSLPGMARDGLGKVNILQGVEMGRPSEITVEVQSSAGSVTGVRVGGSAVVVAKGEFILPNAQFDSSHPSEG
jgi:trans-2,3-dihydro-3-hydroxyanthranilate isomerase